MISRVRRITLAAIFFASASIPAFAGDSHTPELPPPPATSATSTSNPTTQSPFEWLLHLVGLK